jgi:hypothetical protein
MQTNEPGQRISKIHRRQLKPRIIFASILIVVIAGLTIWHLRFTAAADRAADELRLRAVEALRKCDTLYEVTRYSDGSAYRQPVSVASSPGREMREQLQSALLSRARLERNLWRDLEIGLTQNGEELGVVLFIGVKSVYVADSCTPGCVAACPLNSEQFALLYDGFAAARQAEANAKWFYTTGERRAVGLFDRGQPGGKWTFFRKDGTKESEGNFNHGKKSGTWTYWDVNGSETTRIH